MKAWRVILQVLGVNPMRTTRTYLAALFIGLCLFLPLSVDANRDYIKVATFNIAELGEGTRPEARDELAIAGMLVNLDLDLIAIQEVATKERGQSQIQLMTSQMNGLLGPDACHYNCLTSAFQTGDERYAFIWRSPVAITSGPKRMGDRDEYKGSLFVRTPVYCSFNARDFDFVLMNVHLYTRIEKTPTKGRKFEYQQIVKWLKYQVENGSEKDYLIVGDWNRFLDGSSYPRTSAWSTLTYAGFENNFRLVLLEALPGKEYDIRHAPTDEWSTTQASRRSMYDLILISAGAFREFGMVEGELDARFGENVGIEAFDNWPQYKGMSYQTLKYVISDHRPVWAKFKIDLRDDD